MGYNPHAVRLLPTDDRDSTKCRRAGLPMFTHCELQSILYTALFDAVRPTCRCPASRPWSSTNPGRFSQPPNFFQSRGANPMLCYSRVLTQFPDCAYRQYRPLGEASKASALGLARAGASRKNILFRI